MNVIVKKHYPVEKLPADLREGLPLDAEVTVEITTQHKAPPKVRISELVGTLPNIHGDVGEVVRYLREGREDDR